MYNANKKQLVNKTQIQPKEYFEKKKCKIIAEEKTKQRIAMLSNESESHRQRHHQLRRELKYLRRAKIQREGIRRNPYIMNEKVDR